MLKYSSMLMTRAMIILLFQSKEKWIYMVDLLPSFRPTHSDNVKLEDMINPISATYTN